MPCIQLSFSFGRPECSSVSRGRELARAASIEQREQDCAAMRHFFVDRKMAILFETKYNHDGTMDRLATFSAGCIRQALPKKMGTSILLSD
ncbi:hypothetical protein [Rhizobium sp. Rhizsp82]|uniref:hypothetical protein n=1 Tax=Rhizobium sp. Rhizsp82 TaxID=3243057 RepID=UPI0039B552AC